MWGHGCYGHPAVAFCSHLAFSLRTFTGRREWRGDSSKLVMRRAKAREIMKFSFLPIPAGKTDRQRPGSVAAVSPERHVPIPKESASCRSWASLGLVRLQTKRWE